LEKNSAVGKPIRFRWFREKKFGGKRLYYLVYEEQDIVLLVAFGTKKEQQKIISHIMQNRKKYKRIVEQD
jgi:hypothetical protein